MTRAEVDFIACRPEPEPLSMARISTSYDDEEEEKHDFLIFWAFLWNNADATICNFSISVCSFSRGQRTDTNIWVILLFIVYHGVAKIQS